MKSLLLLGIIFLAQGAGAAIVTVEASGTLGLSFGSDDYDLDGASILWTFSYDTTASDVGSGTGSESASASYDAVSNDVAITGRPNSAADTFLALDTAAFMNTTNVFAGSDVDKLGTISGSGMFPNDGSGSNGLAGLMYSDFVFEFADQNYYPGSSPAPLPDLDIADIVTAFTPVIEDGFFMTGYDFVTVNLSVNGASAVVPIPAAAWLFATAIAVLVPLRRRY